MLKRNFALVSLFVLTISSFANAQIFGGIGGIGGIGHDPDHMPRPSIPSYVSVSTCRVDSQLTLNQHDVSLDQLLNFLSKNSLAATGVEQFRAMQSRGEIVVEQLTPTVRAQIQAPGNVVATFQYQPHEKVQHIYVDLAGELGVLSVQFYHEMIHSIDPDLRLFYDEFDRRYPEIQAGIRAVFQQVADRLHKPLEQVDFSDFTPDDFENLKKAKRFQNDGVYRAEYHAFDSQMKLLTQMKTKIPCYQKYITEQDSSNGIHLWYDDIKMHLYMAYGLYEPGTY